MRISCSTLLVNDFEEIAAQSEQTNRQDWVFIYPPENSDGAFQLRILVENIWFCKVLLLFTIETKTDAGIKRHTCALVFVLGEYKGRRRSGMNILHILHKWVFYIFRIL
jgi:hypothetical protein